MRVKQTLTNASLENRPIVLLERFQGNSNRIELQRVKSKHDIFPVKIKLSNKIIIRPNHIHLQKSEAETLTKEAFLDRLGLNAKPKIPVLSISKSVNPLTGAKVFALANKSLPVIGFSKQNRLVIERAPVRSSSILLSPSKPRTMKGQNSLDLSITSNDSESVEDPSDDLLNIDLSSPMGLKLKSLVSSQCQKCSTIRYYDHYCNKIQTQADRRSLRSQTTYCDDRWNMNNIHYVRLPGHIELDRVIAFGYRNRQERLNGRRTGLSKASRKLMKQMRTCYIELQRLTVDPLLIRAPSPASSLGSYSIIERPGTSPSGSVYSSPSKSVICVSSNSTAKACSDLGYSSDEPRHLCNSASTQTRRIVPIDSVLRSCPHPVDMDRASVNSHGKKPAEELLKLTGDDTRKITSTFKPQFMWEDLARDIPQLELRVNTEDGSPIVVDLTKDSDDEGGVSQTPSISPIHTHAHSNRHRPQDKAKKILNRANISEVNPVQARSSGRLTLRKRRRREILIKNINLPYCNI